MSVAGLRTNSRRKRKSCPSSGVAMAWCIAVEQVSSSSLCDELVSFGGGVKVRTGGGTESMF